MPANGVPNQIGLTSYYLTSSCTPEGVASLPPSPPSPPPNPPPPGCAALCLLTEVDNADTNNQANLVNHAAASAGACLQLCLGTCGCWAATYASAQV